ncbi:MAG TPA: aminotransferase class I/II-fold pyridoxal phosphate-dependent enzyme [Anaerolineae bacterium]|nr:aminotransferase class I/II-fold pyridoxal phosphate-dependent enzyme [Anaerolineae bacterium]
MKEENVNWETLGVHGGDDFNPSAGVSSPIYQSATYQFEEGMEIAAAMKMVAPPQFYGRYGSPNTEQAEATIAALEGGEAGLVTASGMAAISLVLLSYLEKGDHVVAARMLYPTTRHLLMEKMPAWGIETTLVEPTDVGAWAAAIRPNTKLIYMETPANPTMELTDLAAVADLAKERGILTVADNTFATPYNQRPLAHGIDLVVHSATKYLAGHSDVVAGAIVGTAEARERLWRTHIVLGGVLHPMEAWLLERGLKTFGLRMGQHNRNGLAVAAFLRGHEGVAEVYYPGLKTHPQYELAQKQMPGGYSGMVCFDLKGGKEAGYRLLQRVELIQQAVSLGGVHSLMTHPASTIAAVGEGKETGGVTPGLVRLSVGVETTADLLADLERGLG